MMHTEVFQYDNIFKFKEVSPAPLVPQQTNAVAYPTEPLQTKHPFLAEDSSMQPSSKHVRTSEKFLRLPCKARTMSNKHNSDTAYLDIPLDAPHGLLLSCSHPECAESGRRFRYCTVCASPVAKRNFTKRHGHGIIQSAKDLKTVDYTCSFVDISSVAANASCYYPCIERTFAEPALEKPRHRRVVSYDKGTYGGDRPSCAIQQPVAATRHAIESSLLKLSANEQEWLNLLHTRPNLKQESKMARWVDKVICFSEEKGSALKKTPVAPIAEQPHFTPMSTPQKQRDTAVMLPLLLPEQVNIEDELICDYFPARSISPFEANIMSMFDEIKAVEPSAPFNRFLRSLELEAPVLVLDDNDLTKSFD